MEYLNIPSSLLIFTAPIGKSKFSILTGTERVQWLLGKDHGFNIHFFWWAETWSSTCRWDMNIYILCTCCDGSKIGNSPTIFQLIQWTQSGKNIKGWSNSVFCATTQSTTSLPHSKGFTQLFFFFYPAENWYLERSLFVFIIYLSGF